MARKTLVYTVTDNNRDKGKAFVITEMPSSQSERWALRALLAASKSGLDIPDSMFTTGMAGLAAFGLSMLAKIPEETALPLFEELMQCVKIMPNPAQPGIVRDLVRDSSENEDIQETQTNLKIKLEVFKLHVNFS